MENSDRFSEDKVLEAEKHWSPEKRCRGSCEICLRRAARGIDPSFNHEECCWNRGDLDKISTFWYDVEEKSLARLQRHGIVCVWSTWTYTSINNVQLTSSCGSSRIILNKLRNFRLFEIDAILQVLATASVFVQIVNSYWSKKTKYLSDQCTNACCGFHGMREKCAGLKVVHDNEWKQIIWNMVELGRPDTASQALRGQKTYHETQGPTALLPNMTWDGWKVWSLLVTKVCFLHLWPQDCFSVPIVLGFFLLHI